MKLRNVLAILVLTCGTTLAGNALGQPAGSFGLRGQVGVGYPTGLVLGGSLTYGLVRGNGSLEFGLSVLGGSLTKDYSASYPREDGGYNTYDETTDLFAVGLAANYLFNHRRETRAGYYLIGAEIGVISVDYETRSETDPTVGGPAGQPLPGGGSFAVLSGTGLDLGLSAGKGFRFSEKLDARILVSGLFMIDVVGYAPGFVPMVSFSLGYEF